MSKNHLEYKILNYLILVSTIFLVSCVTQRDKQHVWKLKHVKESNPLGFLSPEDTLTLTARFSECGEFGGHKETFKIFNNYKKEYFAIYTRDSIDLKCPTDFEQKAVIIQDTTFRLTYKQQKQIIKYLDKLYERVITSKYPSNTADYFTAQTKYSGLLLNSDEPDRNWIEFRKLQQKLTK